MGPRLPKATFAYWRCALVLTCYELCKSSTLAFAVPFKGIFQVDADNRMMLYVCFLHGFKVICCEGFWCEEPHDWRVAWTRYCPNPGVLSLNLLVQFFQKPKNKLQSNSQLQIFGNRLFCNSTNFLSFLVLTCSIGFSWILDSKKHTHIMRLIRPMEGLCSSARKEDHEQTVPDAPPNSVPAIPQYVEPPDQAATSQSTGTSEVVEAETFWSFWGDHFLEVQCWDKTRWG